MRKMYRQVGRKVYLGTHRRKWCRRQWGRIVWVGDSQHYIVRFACGRKKWVRVTDILFWDSWD